MTTPSYAELVAFVRSEGEAIVSASRQDVDVPVPTCPGWTIADLCGHLGQVYARVAHIVTDRMTGPAEWPELPDGVDAVEWMAEALDDLVDALTGCDPETPVWNWASGHPDAAVFWARRMANESAVHRFDAQRAFGIAQPVDADLAADGLDEFLDVMMPAVKSRRGLVLPAAVYAFTSTEDGSWRVRTGDDGVNRADADAVADVTVRGTTSALLLAAYNRVPWSSLEVDGDTNALDAWSRSVSV